jgi:hypothetical protein
LPASDPKFCAPANIAKNFSKLLLSLRIDDTQAFDCEKTADLMIFVAGSTTKCLYRVPVRRRRRPAGDFPVRHSLHLETIYLGNIFQHGFFQLGNRSPTKSDDELS